MHGPRLRKGCQTGAELATKTVDILKDLPSPDAIFFEQTPVAMDEFDTYRELAGRLGRSWRGNGAQARFADATIQGALFSTCHGLAPSAARSIGISSA